MKGMTFNDYRKLVNVFGFNHPFTTIVWNAMFKSNDHDVSEEFEQIYHLYTTQAGREEAEFSKKVKTLEKQMLNSIYGIAVAFTEMSNAIYDLRDLLESDEVNNEKERSHE